MGFHGTGSVIRVMSLCSDVAGSISGVGQVKSQLVYGTSCSCVYEIRGTYSTRLRKPPIAERQAELSVSCPGDRGTW